MEQFRDEMEEIFEFKSDTKACFQIQQFPNFVIATKRNIYKRVVKGKKRGKEIGREFNLF